MIDWNGNGKIDPVDIGVSIAAEEAGGPPPDRRPGCLTACLTAILLPVSLALLLALSA